jgi:hypothetical protein
MEQHPVEDGPLRMSRAIDSRHIRNADSKNVPGDCMRESASRTWISSTSGVAAEGGERPSRKKSPKIKKVFLKDRLILTPVEISGVARHWLFLVFLGLWVLRLLGLRFIPIDFPALLAAVLVGTVLVPALLPWIPGRAFAWKGWLLGLILAAVLIAIHGLPATAAGWRDCSPTSSSYPPSPRSWP